MTCVIANQIAKHCDEPEAPEQVVFVTINDEEREFRGDALTSPIHNAIEFLQQELEKEMVV